MAALAAAVTTGAALPGEDQGRAPGDVIMVTPVDDPTEDVERAAEIMPENADLLAAARGYLDWLGAADTDGDPLRDQAAVLWTRAVTV